MPFAISSIEHSHSLSYHDAVTRVQWKCLIPLAELRHGQDTEEIHEKTNTQESSEAIRTRRLTEIFQMAFVNVHKFHGGEISHLWLKLFLDTYSLLIELYNLLLPKSCERTWDASYKIEIVSN